MAEQDLFKIQRRKAQDMVPVATVKKVGFKKLLKTMDPRYELPVATTLHEKHCHKRTLKSDRALLTGSLT